MKKHTGKSQAFKGRAKVGGEYVVSFGAGLMSDAIVTILPTAPNRHKLDGYSQHMLDTKGALVVRDSTGDISVMFRQYLREIVK